jgi:hypothetical protein
MTRRQRKKEAAREASRLGAPPAAAPKPEPPRRPREEVLLGADGLVEGLVRYGVSREELLIMLAQVAVRVCREGDGPQLAAGSFFATLGEAMAKDERLGAEIRGFERSVDAMRAAFHHGWFGERTKDIRLSAEDRRILRQWTN